jgi:hypothetical protein
VQDIIRRKNFSVVRNYASIKEKTKFESYLESIISTPAQSSRNNSDGHGYFSKRRFRDNHNYRGILYKK